MNRYRAAALPELPVGRTLEHLIGSRTRARVLACLFADVRRPMWLRQIVREVCMGASAVQRELRWLSAIELVHVERLGGAHLYRVDEDHPLCAPLEALLEAAEVTDATWCVPEDGGDAPNRFR